MQNGKHEQKMFCFQVTACVHEKNNACMSRVSVKHDQITVISEATFGHRRNASPEKNQPGNLVTKDYEVYVHYSISQKNSGFMKCTKIMTKQRQLHAEQPLVIEAISVCYN